MPTAVPALDRTMQILELLRNRPLDPMTLSDISRATGIHKATCASTLTTMAAYDMVRRDESLRYSIGSRFVGLAHAFSRQYPAFFHGREDVVRLVARTELSCAAIARDGDDLVILDMLGNAQPAHLRMRTGMRVPLVPPVGTIFKAWEPVAEQDAWIDGMIAEFGGERDEYVGAIAALRARAFSLGGEHDFHLALDTALRQATRAHADDRVLEVAMIVADKIRNYSTATNGDEPINSVIGPIFDAEGRVTMTLNLFGELGSVRRRDLDSIVPSLLGTCARVTQKAGGRLPEGFGLHLL
ncbi:helix-turn-helix domain-containing protein [Pseudonocardia nematodicida]|uniref:Helix-turn-helix domain-containing protein n=1 Tax=Pseudonocardia nematodicida TaxID=1206997 RepID=A0ABV1K5A5_9PSEU